MELKNISVNGTKGKGKGSWTSAQTSVIAKNGGEITTDNFKDIGAIVGSENEKEKLKISAKTIEVKDLEDSNKYENVGGGISLGFEENKPQVPNISVVHDKIDKKQITRATALNTEISLNGKEEKAEDLGFNTDISNSQETTKDKEKHLNAELHTDLFNKSERNKLIEAKKKIETVVENLGNSNRFKEGIAGVELDKFKNERQKEFNLINDQNISLEDKRRIVQDLYRDFLRSKGYKGDIPEVILTDEENSFSVDSKDKETGEKRKERIFISINNLNNKDFSKVFVHELAHMNTYDEGYLGEETSLYTRSKLEPDDKTKVFSEADKEKYLESLRTEYPKQKSLEEQYAEAKLVPEKDREHWMITISEGLSVGMGYYLNFNGSIGTIIDENSGKVYVVTTVGGTLGLATPSITFAPGVNMYPYINNPAEVSGSSINGGGSRGNFGLDINIGKERTSFGIQVPLSKLLPKFAGTAKAKTLLIEAFPKLKNILKYEVHGGVSYTQLIGAVEITNKEFLSKLEKKDGIITKSPENILKITNYLKENPDKLKVLEDTTEKLIKKQREIDPYQ